MQFTRLGRTGLTVSRLCLGCMSFGDPSRGGHGWVISEDDSRAVIRAALEAGINFFDTANVYSGGSSEEITGRALRDFANRDEIVLATKAHGPWRNAPNAVDRTFGGFFQRCDRHPDGLSAQVRRSDLHISARRSRAEDRATIGRRYR